MPVALMNFMLHANKYLDNRTTIIYNALLPQRKDKNMDNGTFTIEIHESVFRKNNSFYIYLEGCCSVIVYENDPEYNNLATRAIAGLCNVFSITNRAWLTSQEFLNRYSEAI